MDLSVEKIEKRYRMSLYELVRYQLFTDLIFIHKLNITMVDINLLSLLSFHDGIELSKFCSLATDFFHPGVDARDFANKSQNLRNRLNKLLKQDIIFRENHRIFLNGIKVQNSNPSLVTYKFLGIDETDNTERDSKEAI